VGLRGAIVEAVRKMKEQEEEIVRLEQGRLGERFFQVSIMEVMGWQTRIWEC